MKTHDAEKRYKNSIKFKLNKSVLSGKRAMFFTRWVWKCMAYAAALILLIPSLFYGYLIRNLKALKGKWPYKKGKRSSIHYSDD